MLLPIYAADEQPIPGVSSELIGATVAKRGGNCVLAQNKVEAAGRVMSLVRPGDLILTEGAGDVCVIGDLVIQELNRSFASAL